MNTTINYHGKPTTIGRALQLQVTYKNFKEALDAGNLEVDDSIPNNFIPASIIAAPFRFRFPFPDEDTLGFLSPGLDPNRTLLVAVPTACLPADLQFDHQLDTENGLALVYICGQRPYVEPKRAKVGTLISTHQNPAHGKISWLSTQEAVSLTKAITDNYVIEAGSFYAQVCARILEGYGLPYKFNPNYDITEPAPDPEPPQDLKEKKAMLQELINQVGDVPGIHEQYEPAPTRDPGAGIRNQYINREAFRREEKGESL